MQMRAQALNLCDLRKKLFELCKPHLPLFSDGNSNSSMMVLEGLNEIIR